MRALHAKGPKFRLFRPRPASGAHVVAPALMVEKRLMATPIRLVARIVRRYLQTHPTSGVTFFGFLGFSFDDDRIECFVNRACVFNVA